MGHGYLDFDIGYPVRAFWSRYAESNSIYTCKFILSASNDNASWVQISDMQIQEDAGWKTADTNNYYRYYRIACSDTHSDGFNLYTLKFDKCYKEETLDYDTLLLNNKLENYEKGLRCLIEIPDNFSQQGLLVYMNINNLGRKLINGTITAGKKYELVYDGTTFNAMEVTL